MSVLATSNWNCPVHRHVVKGDARRFRCRSHLVVTLVQVHSISLSYECATSRLPPGRCPEVMIVQRTNECRRVTTNNSMPAIRVGNALPIHPSTGWSQLNYDSSETCRLKRVHYEYSMQTGAHFAYFNYSFTLMVDQRRCISRSV